MHRPHGFSLLEVLVAVAVLATGLLALAALQGALARGTAEAKVRAHVLTLLSGELDALRATPFADIATRATTIDARNPDCNAPSNDVEHAACDAGIRGLLLHRSFTTASDAASMSVRVAAEWTAHSSETRTLELRTVLGALTLDPNRNHAPTHPSLHPQVRHAAAAIPGADALPILLGDGRLQATTTPRIDALGTRFDVVAYTPEPQGAQLHGRIEMEVVKCRCRYDTGGAHLGPVHRIARWPALWTGTRYSLYASDDAAPAPGSAYTAGPDPDVVQSPRCRECCRDRHDSAGPSPHPKFDAINSDAAYRKYDLDPSGALIEAADTTSATYVDSCRLIRVDGWWRTATDLHMRHFALLQTATIDGIPAAARKPDPDAAQRYTGFVRDYLAQYADAHAPDNASALHDEPGSGLNLPTHIPIAPPPPTDRRHLHARALYVDAFEPVARKALDDAIDARRANDACALDSAQLADCVLPFLPFFTLDLTDIATWSAHDADLLAVDTHDPAAPTPLPGGRVRAIAPGITDVVAAARLSNSGAAASAHIPGATDAQGDQATLEDAQTFEIRESGAAHVDATPRRRPEYAPPPE